MNITYRQVGDYKIPNFTLPPEAKEIRLGKWGRAHGLYLQKNKQLEWVQRMNNIHQRATEVVNKELIYA